MESENIWSSKPRNRANLSPVWRYFSRIGDARSCLGSCLYCGTEVAVPGGSTTGMFSHLSVHHPEAYKEAKDYQLNYKLKNVSDTSPNPIDLSSRMLQASSPKHSSIGEVASKLSFPGPSTVIYKSPPTPQIVAVKPLEPRHVQLSVFPYLYHSYLRMRNGVNPIEDVCHYDLVLHCHQGVVLANKLLLAAVSHFARKLLEDCHQQVSHLVLADVPVEAMEVFVKSIYHGTLNFKDDSLYGIFDLFGIPYNVKTTMIQQRESLDDIGEDSDDSYIEPELHLDVGQPPTESLDDEAVMDHYSSGTVESDIEARAQELKDKIFAECGLVPKRSGKIVRNTRNPSKIWKWFTKTQTFIYCKICGVGIKNSGNTTNASSHLKRHPEHYAEFKLETAAQLMDGASGASASETDSMEPNMEQRYDRMVWKYFQTSKKANRKAKCYLCGKETPMGSNNVLLHLKHHHPQEHAKILDHLSRSQRDHILKQVPEREKVKESASKITEQPNVVIKMEPDYHIDNVQIKVEIEDDEK